MQSVHTPVEVDRRHWHLDKTLNVSHLLTTVVIAGSLFAYANNMDRRVAILEEKMQAQAVQNQQSAADVKELATDVKHELRLLRQELLSMMRNKSGEKP